MSNFEGSVLIARSPRAVWDYVTDLEQTPNWRTTVRTVDPPERLEVGAVFGATTHVLGRRWRWKLAVDEFDPPTTMTMSVAEGFTDLTVTYRVEPIGDGCRFTMVASSQAERRRERLLEPLAAWALRREARRHLANLKDILERPPPGRKDADPA